LDEGLAPHTVDEVWLMASPRAQVAVDITDTISQKLAALHCHKSQLADPARLDEMIREWGGANAKAHGLAEGRFAEGFQVVITT
jgi:LmbE family N-acetylglucosaminyl deacetylase